MNESLLLKAIVPQSRFLVYTSAGNRSNVDKWVSGRKNFDLWVTQYIEGSPRLQQVADYYNERKGGKFPNFHFVYNNWNTLIAQYDAVAVFDDDIEISGTEISRLFRILCRYRLALLQPGFLKVGKISHRVTIAKHWSFARHTTFVEIGVVVFSKPILDRFMAVYDPRLVGHGVDWWYLHLLRDNERHKVAVVDAISCINPDERLVKCVRDIDALESTSKRIKVWEEIKKIHAIEYPNEGVKTLDRIWPSAFEDWLMMVIAPLKRLQIYLLYPHHVMRLKRLYWRFIWRLRGSSNAW